MDKFLFASNPMSGAGTQAIVHMLNPLVIILVETGQEPKDRPHKHYKYTAADGSVEPITFTAMHSHHYNEANEIHIEKLFDKAWHWYIALRKHMDNNEQKNKTAGDK